MNSHRLARRNISGYALLSVLIFMGVMALLTASMLSYSTTERRLNERNRLLLRARNMAENVALYASEQVTTKLYRLRTSTEMAFMTGSNRIHLPPDSVLATEYSQPGDVEVRAGIIDAGELTYIDPTNAANASHPNVGLSITSSEVPIIAKSTMHHPALGSITAYVQQDLEVSMIPLFQFGIFYNMDLELFPGQDMTINGPVHTNGKLLARGEVGGSADITFSERVTVADSLLANGQYKVGYRKRNGTNTAGGGGTGAVYYTAVNGTKFNLQGGSPSIWRDHMWGGSTETATTTGNFRAFATKDSKGNLRTSVHGVTKLELPSIGSYKDTNDPATAEDDRDNGRQIVAAPDPDDPAGVAEAKFGRNAGLYIVVNPDDEVRTGRLPNGNAVSMRARSYRTWLNTINNDGSQTVSEVILPGQPSYGALNANVNNLPNAYRTDTSVSHNQVLRIPQGTGDLADTGYANATAPSFPNLTDSYFYDMRRANGNRGYPHERGTHNYVPRPIAKIDFDLTRFRMAVERTLLAATTSTVYNPSLPTASTWASSIFNPAGTRSAHGLGIGGSFDSFPEMILTIEGKEKPGAGGVIKEYDGRFIIAESSDGGGTWTDRYRSTADENTKSHTVTDGTTHVRIRQYLSGSTPSYSDDGTAAATTRMLDEYVLPMIKADGTSNVTATLSNEYHIIAIAPAGALSSTHLDEYLTGTPEFAHTDMQVYIGGVEDTVNWTFTITGTTGGAGGTLGTGSQANRFTWTDLTSTSGTVTITANKGSATISQTLRLDRQDGKTLIKTPAQQSRWIAISAAAGADPFKIYFAPANPADARIATDPDAFLVRPTQLVSTSSPSPWFDGIAVYVHSAEAEVRAQTSNVPNRVDSGVRLWNGRGPLLSLDGISYPGRTGFSFATNDVAYIVGHFNADGVINTTSTSTGNGGYSARYPDSSTERLAGVMADAITILSQPTFNASYVQTSGWNDALSTHAVVTSSSYSNNWDTTNPGNSNQYDGENTSRRPAIMPNLSTPAGSGTQYTAKLPTVHTEISSALLMGIVPSNHNPTGLTDGPPSSGANQQYSGGAHNFPRMMEAWNDRNLFIRGSMVALFESRVGMEPWNLRVYSAPDRYWGLHENFRAENGAHDLPLEPIVINAQRMRYRELSPTGYTTQKTVIEALPH